MLVNRVSFGSNSSSTFNTIKAKVESDIGKDRSGENYTQGYAFQLMALSLARIAEQLIGNQNNNLVETLNQGPGRGYSRFA